MAACILHAPPQEKNKDRVDLTWLHPFFLSSPAVTCNKKKENAGS
jgi:hypothetical protein